MVMLTGLGYMYDVMILHQWQPSEAGDERRRRRRPTTVPDIIANKLQVFLERAGFSLWPEEDSRRFEEGVQRSKVVVICVSEQSEVAEFKQRLVAMRKFTKPIAVAVVQPEYRIPRKPQDTKKKPAPPLSLEDAVYHHLSIYQQFAVCGKTLARTNVDRLVLFIKEGVRQACAEHLAPGQTRCYCWVCGELAREEEQEAELRDAQDNGQGEDEADGQITGQKKQAAPPPAFFISSTLSPNGQILLADPTNERIVPYDLTGDRLEMSETKLRGIRSVLALDSGHVLVVHKIRRLGDWVSWMTLANEDLTETQPWVPTPEIARPELLARLNRGLLAVTEDGRKGALGVAQVHVVNADTREVKTAFKANVAEVTDIAGSPHSDVIAVSSWRTHEVRLFDYSGRQLWFHIWKEDVMLRSPWGLAFVREGELLVCDKDANLLYFLDSHTGGTIRTFSDESLRFPQGLLLAGERLVVTDCDPDPKFIQVTDLHDLTRRGHEVTGGQEVTEGQEDKQEAADKVMIPFTYF